MAGSMRYSASSPQDVDESVDELARLGDFSAVTTETLEQRAAMNKLRDLVTDYSERHGPIAPEEIRAARAALRH